LVAQTDVGEAFEILVNLVEAVLLDHPQDREALAHLEEPSPEI